MMAVRRGMHGNGSRTSCKVTTEIQNSAEP